MSEYTSVGRVQRVCVYVYAKAGRGSSCRVQSRQAGRDGPGVLKEGARQALG